MSVTVTTSGSLLADGTEQSIAASGVSGIYYLVLDASAMQSGDTLRIFANLRAINGGALGTVLDTEISGAQDTPVIITDPFGSPYGIEFFIEQTAGTYRTYPYSLERIGNCQAEHEDSLLMDGTEQGLLDFNNNLDSWIVIDTDPIDPADEFTLRCYRKVLLAGDDELVWTQDFPIDGMTTRHAYSVVLGFPHGGKYTLEQSSGSYRTIDFSVRSTA